VGQQDGVNLGRFDPEILPVTVLQVAFLIQAAIDKNLGMVEFNQMTRSGDRLSGSEKSKLYIHETSPYCHFFTIFSTPLSTADQDNR
jgi:hypothetical protein